MLGHGRGGRQGGPALPFAAWTRAGRALSSTAVLVRSKGGHSSEAEDGHVSWHSPHSGRAEQPPAEPLGGWVSAEPAQPSSQLFPELHLLLINAKAP